MNLLEDPNGYLTNLSTARIGHNEVGGLLSGYDIGEHVTDEVVIGGTGGFSSFAVATTGAWYDVLDYSSRGIGIARAVASCRARPIVIALAFDDRESAEIAAFNACSTAHSGPFSGCRGIQAFENGCSAYAIGPDCIVTWFGGTGWDRSIAENTALTNCEFESDGVNCTVAGSWCVQEGEGIVDD